MKMVTLAASAGLQRLQLGEAADPGAPQAGELRVRIHATSLNYHDYGVVTSNPPRSSGRVPMADGAGIIEAVGAGVTEFKSGDHVVSTFFPYWFDGAATQGDFSAVPGDGIDGYAREVVVRPAHFFTRAPATWSHPEAATLTTAGLTAWRTVVEDGALRAGDTVVILGTGGVAMFALQLVKLMGGIAIMTSSSDEKLKRAHALGADLTVNYRSRPNWGVDVLSMTDGRGADHVIEMGGPGTLPQSIVATRVGGHISLVGTVTGYAGEVPTAQLMRKQIRLQGVIVGSRRQQMSMVRALDASRLRPVIDRTFRGLDTFAEAFAYEEGREHMGKICVEIP
jgi:NADPH:quinone reductase-like Zn-dependent oxidoreductase